MQQLLLLSSDSGWGESLNRVLSSHAVAFEMTDVCSVALEKVKAGFPDVIVADSDFSRYYSFVFTRLVKFDTHTRHLPLVLLSSSPLDESLAYEIRADLFLLKPISAESLWEKVALWH